MEAVNNCEGGVRLVSPYGDVYNPKSQLSQYIAITELLSEHGEDLELFCDNCEDESKFFEFFRQNPEVVESIHYDPEY